MRVHQMLQKMLFLCNRYCYFFSMKNYRKFILVTLISTAFVLLGSVNFQDFSVQAQTASPSAENLLISSELLNGTILAVISGLVGFLASFVLEKINKRTESKKQISFSKSVEHGITGME